MPRVRRLTANPFDTKTFTPRQGPVVNGPAAIGGIGYDRTPCRWSVPTGHFKGGIGCEHSDGCAVESVPHHMGGHRNDSHRNIDLSPLVAGNSSHARM
jgi:hypothetical protein